MIANSTRLRHLLALILLASMGAALAAVLVPAVASGGNWQTTAWSTVTARPTLRYGSHGAAVGSLALGFAA